MPVTRHRANRGALGVWQVRHSLRRVQAPENPGGLRASGRSLEWLVDTARYPVVSGGAPVPGRLSVLSVVDLCHGRQLAPVNEEGGHPREPQARGGGRRPGCTPATARWVDRQASCFPENQTPGSSPQAQPSGEPERGAGSPQGLGVYGGMLPLPEATRRAAPPSGAGVSRPLDALPLRGGVVLFREPVTLGISAKNGETFPRPNPYVVRAADRFSPLKTVPRVSGGAWPC
jgi:hypothetical protein